MTAVVGIALIAAIAVLGVLLGRAYGRADADAQLDAAAGRAAEDAARAGLAEEAAERAEAVQEVTDAIEKAVIDIPSEEAPARVGARWGQLRVVHPDGDGGSSGSGDDQK